MCEEAGACGEGSLDVIFFALVGMALCSGKYQKCFYCLKLFDVAASAEIYTCFELD